MGTWKVYGPDSAPPSALKGLEGSTKTAAFASASAAFQGPKATVAQHAPDIQDLETGPVDVGGQKNWIYQNDPKYDFYVIINIITNNHVCSVCILCIYTLDSAFVPINAV